MIRTLVVDDTVLYRTVLSDALGAIPEVRVIGTAPNGRIALSRIYSLKPDLVTLDIEMPEMNGIEVLEALKAKGLDTCVVVVSSLTRRGGELTMRALELGAFDFIMKPEGGKEGLEDFARTLGVIVGGVAKRLEIRKILKDVVKPAAGVQTGALAAAQGERREPRPQARPASQALGGGRKDIVAIGSSTGGPQALLGMLPAIPSDITVPILIVQHMPPLFTANLAHSLDARCGFRVKEAEDGETLKGGVAYIAPGGKQMKIVLAQDAATKIIRVTDDPPENHCRPSADYLFRSVAHLFYGKATGVIMTGMGNDGTAGLEALKRAGATIIAQDEKSCVVYGMPKSAVDAGVVDSILPLDRIAAAIAATVR